MADFNRKLSTLVEPTSIHQKAARDLDYIRQTMERASAFTAVPGRGGIAMGIVALVAGFYSARLGSEPAWLFCWLAAAAIAVGIGFGAMLTKAARVNVSLARGAGRRFVLSLFPPILAGAGISAALYKVGDFSLLPGTWLLLYGTGIVTGGAYSVRVVPIMGLCFMFLGFCALFASFETAKTLMLAGFAGLHIVFGGIIARRYGG